MSVVDPQSYDRLAEHYEEVSALGPDPVTPWLPGVLPAARGAALDVGCGGGRHAVLLAEHFDRVVAVDLSESMVDLAQRRRPRANIEYRVGDPTTIDGTYDLVFSSAMLHHVADLAAALDQLQAVVAPAGRAVLVDVIAPDFLPYRIGTAVAPRTYYRLGAVRGLAVDVFRRDPEARRRYRAATFRPWLDHLATDRFLTRTAFDAVYGAAFPGATFHDLSYLRACVWDGPGG